MQFKSVTYTSLAALDLDDDQLRSIHEAAQSLNGIDPIDVRRSYRYEQGFTYELTLAGVGAEQRAAFAEKRTDK